MNEKNKKRGLANVKSKEVFKRMSINEDHSTSNKKPNDNTMYSKTYKNSKNKRSYSQLETIKPFQFKSEEGISLHKSMSRNSLNLRNSMDKESNEDNFTTTFQNMFSHFNKLTEIMTNSSRMNGDSFKHKSSKFSNRTLKLSGTKRLDTYEPLTENQKMNFLNEITRGSEQRMKAYNTIFNTIKSQIGLISKREDEDEIEKDLLNTLKRNNSNLIIENVTKTTEKTRDSDRNFNIINNNITVNIISNDGKKPEIENFTNFLPTGFKDKINPLTNKGSSNSNASVTYNDDIEEEIKQNAKNLVVPSNSFKNKIDLENSSFYTLSRKSSNSHIHQNCKRKTSTKLFSNESNLDDLDKLNKNLEIRTTFLIAKSELNQNKQHRLSMNELRPKEISSPSKTFRNTFNPESNSINSSRQEDISLEKKNCMII